jgi:hypothetical protein
MSRGRALLRAQRSSGLPRIGPPPEWLDAREAQAWHDVVAAAPDVLRISDEIFLEIVARELVDWRNGRREPGFARTMYRDLGRCFIPMRERRRLLFPQRMKPVT